MNRPERGGRAAQTFKTGVMSALQEGRSSPQAAPAPPPRPRNGSRVYVASPLGFNVPGRHWADEVLHPRLVAAGWEVLDPWADQTGEVAAALALPPGPSRVEALQQMSRTIGARNRRLLAEADAVLAVLDGPDVDSGTAAEIGWAAAHGTPVVGRGPAMRLGILACVGSADSAFLETGAAVGVVVVVLVVAVMPPPPLGRRRP